MSEHETGQSLLDGRESVYGERVKNMEDVAKVWSGIFGFDVRADQVTLAMMGYKLVRASGTPDYSDNIDDVEGYAIMFREIIGDKMINAKSVSDYLAQKTHPLEQAAQDHLAHLTPAQKIMAADSVKMQEACTHCYQLSCDGDCELRKRERAYNSTLEPEINEAQVVELTDRIERLFDENNSFVYGHRAAAEVAAGEAERYYAEYVEELQQKSGAQNSEIIRLRERVSNMGWALNPDRMGQ